MKTFDGFVAVIAEGFREDCEFEGCTIKELFRAQHMTVEDFIDEAISILNDSEESKKYVFTDELELFDGDKDYSAKQIFKAVKAYEF